MGKQKKRWTITYDESGAPVHLDFDECPVIELEIPSGLNALNIKTLAKTLNAAFKASAKKGAA